MDNQMSQPSPYSTGTTGSPDWVAGYAAGHAAAFSIIHAKERDLVDCISGLDSTNLTSAEIKAKALEIIAEFL